MCELASTDHPFFSFELPFHLLLHLALAADRRFPRERSFGPAYLLNASFIFPSPVRNSYTSAREHACNLPRFRKRVRKPDVSCQWELIRHSRGISYESCVNKTTRKKRWARLSVTSGIFGTIVHRMVSRRASHIFQKDAINLTIEVTFTRRHSYAIPRYDTQARYIKINNESNDLLTCFLKIGVTFFDCISA